MNKLEDVLVAIVAAILLVVAWVTVTVVSIAVPTIIVILLLRWFGVI